jgi:hypothetical protein
MSLDERLTEAITRTTERESAPAFDLAGIRRGARRRTAVRAAAGAAVVAVVVAGVAGIQLSGDDKSLPPVELPTSTPSPTPSPSPSTDPTVIPDGRDGQVVVTWDEPPSKPSVPTLLGKETSDDPDNAGDGEVAVSGSIRAYMVADAMAWERYCTGAPGTWWVFTVEPQISFFSMGRCDGSGQPTSAPARESLDGPMVGSPRDLPGRPTKVTLRMILTDQDPTAYYDCVTRLSSEGCTDLEPPHAVDSGARFGISLYGRDPAPVATTIFGSEVYPAARFGSTTYSFTTAVAAPTGSRLLTYRLPASTHQRIVQTMAGQAEPCRHTEGDHSDPDCLPAPKVRIDGQLIDNSNNFLATTLGARAELAPGGAHDVTLEIPAGDDDRLDLGFVVFEARAD